MSKESFLLYHGYYEPIKNLSLEDKGMLFDAIFQYSIHGSEPSNTCRIYMAFQFFKNQIDQDSKKYQRIVETAQENGKLGGRPKTHKTQSVISEPKKAVTVTVTDTVTVNDTVTDRAVIEKSIFSDELFISDLKRMHSGKDLTDAWNQCWTHFSQQPTKLVEWEWRQKFSSWLVRYESKKKFNGLKI